MYRTGLGTGVLMVDEIGTEGVAEMVAGNSRCPSTTCDDCWNQVRPDGADPREADTLAGTEEDLARVERYFISTGPGSRMRSQVTQVQRRIRALRPHLTFHRSPR